MTTHRPTFSSTYRTTYMSTILFRLNVILRLAVIVFVEHSDGWIHHRLAPANDSIPQDLRNWVWLYTSSSYKERDRRLCFCRCKENRAIWNSSAFVDVINVILFTDCIFNGAIHVFKKCSSKATKHHLFCCWWALWKQRTESKFLFASCLHADSR